MLCFEPHHSFLLHPISPTMYTILFLLLLFTPSFSSSSQPPFSNILLQSDAVHLLSFKSKADSDNILHYTLNEHFDYCTWQGVKCVRGRVVRFGLQSLPLMGRFEPDTLTRLDQLRILILRNTSLSGPVPDFSGLKNLKTLFLDRNFFSGGFPPSLLFLHQLLNLDLSKNGFSGSIPVELNRLDRVISLRLESNRFSGSIPPLNQTTLAIFNVSGNNLTGPVPVTSTLKKFTVSSFNSNPNLCGDVVNKPCRSPFFDSPPSAAAAPPTPLLQNASEDGDSFSPPPHTRHKRIGVILGLLIASLILIAIILSILGLIKRRGLQIESKRSSQSSTESENISDSIDNYTTIGAKEVNKEPKSLSVNKVTVQAIELPRQQPAVVKSGSLKFCSDEAEIYSIEQLMRGSAELLGRGTIGTTYKAVMDRGLIVCVKRLDATKAGCTSGEAFENHLESVGVLRHPNLVPVRAYFQAKQERLIIYDYQPNGSLFNLIHGSRSTRAKPLHWTSCLKLAEDVAQGLVYIHQASGLVHGNLKSSNVLLGSDFEACLTDYCLSVLADSSPNDDPDSMGYKAPEVLKSANRSTSKSDVFAFGVLLLELLSSKPPSQHPFLAPPDVADWVRVMRDDNTAEDRPLGLLVDVATVCSLRSPEQRPTMRQVLKMIQDIKESAMVDSGTADSLGGYS